MWAGSGSTMYYWLAHFRARVSPWIAPKPLQHLPDSLDQAENVSANILQSGHLKAMQQPLSPKYETFCVWINTLGWTTRQFPSTLFSKCHRRRETKSFSKWRSWCWSGRSSVRRKYISHSCRSFCLKTQRFSQNWLLGKRMFLLTMRRRSTRYKKFPNSKVHSNPKFFWMRQGKNRSSTNPFLQEERI